MYVNIKLYVSLGIILPPASLTPPPQNSPCPKNYTLSAMMIKDNDLLPNYTIDHIISVYLLLVHCHPWLLIPDKCNWVKGSSTSQSSPSIKHLSPQVEISPVCAFLDSLARFYQPRPPEPSACFMVYDPSWWIYTRCGVANLGSRANKLIIINHNGCPWSPAHAKKSKISMMHGGI